MPEAVTYVPDAEVEEYERHGCGKIQGVPDDVKGITRTRNWILDNTSEDWIVMVDDDLKRVGWMEMLPFNVKERKIAAEVCVDEWAKLFDVAEGMGFRVWGTATQASPRSIYPYIPLRFRTVITASCMGLRNSTGIRFDESFPVKEDYELCLRCILEDGGIVGAQYFYWENDHWSGAGGCETYRTGEMERDCINRLMRMYPGIVRKVERKGTDYAIEVHF